MPFLLRIIWWQIRVGVEASINSTSVIVGSVVRGIPGASSAGSLIADMNSEPVLIWRQLPTSTGKLVKGNP